MVEVQKFQDFDQMINELCCFWLFFFFSRKIR